MFETNVAEKFETKSLINNFFPEIMTFMT